MSRYDKPGAWLRRVTINLANSLLRRRVSEVRALQRYVAARIEVVDAHPVEEAKFWNQVKALPRGQRDVIVLHYVDGMDTGEIADVLDISESSVRTHLQRGRETLVRKVDSNLNEVVTRSILWALIPACATLLMLLVPRLLSPVLPVTLLYTFAVATALALRYRESRKSVEGGLGRTRVWLAGCVVLAGAMVLVATLLGLVGAEAR